MVDLDERKRELLLEQVQNKVSSIHKARSFLLHIMSRMVEEYGDLRNYVAASADEGLVTRVENQYRAFVGVKRYLAKGVRLSSNESSNVDQYLRDIEDLRAKVSEGEEILKGITSALEKQQKEIAVILEQIEKFPLIEIKDPDRLLTAADRRTIQRRKLSRLKSDS